MTGDPTHEVTVTVTPLGESDEKPSTLTTKVRCGTTTPVHVEAVVDDDRDGYASWHDTDWPLVHRRPERRTTRYRVVIPDVETYTVTVPARASRVRLV